MTMPASIDEQFSRYLGALSGSPDTSQSRSAALSRFNTLGFPTRKNERWRYTDTKPLRDGQFDFVPERPAVESIDAARRVLEARSVSEPLVFVDGHFIEELSAGQLEPGVEVLHLPITPTRDDQDTADGTEHALSQLNTAFAPRTTVIRVAPDARPKIPISIAFVTLNPALACQIRLGIEAGARSEAEIVQHFLAQDAGRSAWTNIVTDIDQDQDSVLTICRIQENAETHLQTALIRATLRSNAKLTGGSIDIGGALTRSEIEISLIEPGAHADLFGLAVAASGQHVDNQISVDHAVPETTSVQTYRNIVGARGRCVFNGKVLVRKGARKIDAHQSSDNLLLAANAEVDTKPELEIYADDVKCSHGATIGEIDNDHLFYLRSRGLDESAARQLLTTAFANVILERFADDALRERLVEVVDRKLADGLDTEGA